MLRLPSAASLRQPLAAEAQQALRFACVGALGVVVNSTVLWLLTERLGLYYLVSSVLATEAAICFNFFLNHRWTFGGRRDAERVALKLAKYNALSLGGLLLTVVSLWLLTTGLHLHYLVANVLAIGTGTLWNYTANRRWTWPRQADAHPAAGHLSRATGGGLRVAGLRVAGLRGAARRIGRRSHWRPPDARRWRTASLGIGASAIALLVAAAWVAATLPGAWAVVGALALGAVFVFRRGADGVPPADRRAALRSLLAAAVAVSAVDYLAWRLNVTNWDAWWLALPLFGAELFGALHTLGMHYTVWPRRAPEVRVSAGAGQLPIYVLIPTVNEAPDILERTVRAARAAGERYLERFPGGRVTTVVCNDGFVAGAPGWRATEALAERLGVACVTRRVGGGAKAGNLEHARRAVGATGDALVVIFDADQVAEPEFLLRTVPPFADPAMAWVQTGQYYCNLDNPVARWADDQQALFYRVLCPGKSAQNAAFIYGTNVVLRAAALDEIGGLPQDSVTEDFAASIELHARWRGIFLPGVLARGLGPVDLPSFFAQQRRWATGTLGVLRRRWRTIVLPVAAGRDGLTRPQRVQYALACTHYVSGLRDAIYILAPVLFLVTGIPAVRGADLAAFATHFLPYWLATQIAFWYVAGRHTSVRGIVIGFGSFPVLVGSLLTVVLGRRIGFVVTPKRRGGPDRLAALWQLAPHVAAALACLVSLGFAATATGDRAPVVISALWVLYSLLMLAGVLWLGIADALPLPVRRGRAALEHTWHRALRPALLGAGGMLRPAWLRPALAGAVALSVVGATLGTAASGAPVPAFEPRAEAGQRRFGVSVPVELLGEAAEELERQLGEPFDLVGRTQTVGNSFDAAWAQALAARGARPWITLVFGTDRPGADLEPSLEASLPAIANGVHDQALRRWARSLRAYGRPVYLTVLPHVDRDWALSSAVTNGGIPQDAPRAWRHVRDVFAREGAANVAWVWAPADPLDDGRFAPPPETVDLVALSLISYPDGVWYDPTTTLAILAARHPGTPLLLEISAADDPVRKAAWLNRVREAVFRTPALHAVVYHEGSPDPRAVAEAHGPWSMGSDPLALDALRGAARATRAGRQPATTAGGQVADGRGR